MFDFIIDIEKKRCGKCEEIKPVTEFFIRRRKTKISRAVWCKNCMLVYNTQWIKNNPEKQKARERRSYLNNKDNHRSFHLKTKYNLTHERYNKILESQHGKCAICNKFEITTRGGVIRNLCVDHNHKTNEIRQLLCSDCNQGIGLFKDDPDLIEKAILYLKQFSNDEDM